VSGNYGDDRLRIWDAATARVRKEIQGPAGTFRFVTVSPDGRRVAATAYDAQIKYHLRVCDVAAGERLFSAEGGALAYSPDGATLASGSGDSTVRLWDTAPLKTRHQARREAAAPRPKPKGLSSSCGAGRTTRPRSSKHSGPTEC
jgi:WD40 repeat protein